jgi:hypothetical protein
MCTLFRHIEERQAGEELKFVIILFFFTSGVEVSDTRSKPMEEN